MPTNLTPRTVAVTIRFDLGEVPERLKGPVSKTGVALVVTVGSNPTLSVLTERVEFDYTRTQ